MRVFGIVDFWDYGQCWRDEEVSCLFWFWCWILWTRELWDQTFIEKEDAVIIIVCCYLEKIRTKLICKGGNTIKSIEDIPPEKPQPPPPPVPRYLAFIYPIGVCCKSCCEGCGGGSCHHGYGIPHQPPSYDGYVRLVPSYGPNLEDALLMKEWSYLKLNIWQRKTKKLEEESWLKDFYNLKKLCLNYCSRKTYYKYMVVFAT